MHVVGAGGGGGAVGKGTWTYTHEACSIWGEEFSVSVF